MAGRRGVLGRLGTLLAAAALPMGPARLFGAGDDARDAELEREVKTLGRRVYSEQGIPMVLACEDLTAKAVVAPVSRAMNAEFAPVFERCVEAWERVDAAASAEDVASLVELLAYRDFASGGRSAE